MKINILVAFSAVLGVVGGSALARQQPDPPPSGIVVHLFGPDSITSHILPEAAAPGGAASPNAPAASAAPVTAGGMGQPAAPAATGYQGPDMHDILHQMFVTGDPDLKPGENIAPGRTKDHP